MPAPSCSGNLLYDGLTYPNGVSTTDMDVSVDSNHYYSTTAANAVTDLPTMYDVVGNQYPRDYFHPSRSTLPNTPLETPPCSHTPMQAFDISSMAQSSTMEMPHRQNTWDSKWKSLFDTPKVQDAHSLSPTASQQRHPSQSDSGLLAAEFEEARRQSTDTGSTSTKSIRSGNHPVPTVLVSMSDLRPEFREADAIAGTSRV